MSCLTLIQDAAVRLALPPPATVVGNSDKTARLLLALANQEGRELARRHDWQALTTERTFTSLAQVAQTGAIPDDYDRLVYNAEIWDRTRLMRFAGPTSPHMWQQLQTGLGVGICGYWRLLGGELNILPAPAAGHTLAFEYVSQNWVRRPLDGTRLAAFGADADESLLSEDLMTDGIVWRWGASTKSYDYAEAMATYERNVEKAASRDRGTGVIRPSSSHSTPPVPAWPGVVTVP
jgi:hypothetical protein